MARKTDEEIQKVFDDYNKLRAKNDYWVDAGLALIDHLHKEHRMRYSDIYEIAERSARTHQAKEVMLAPRTVSNVITFPVIRVERS